MEGQEHRVCPVEDIPTDEFHLVEVAGKPIGMVQIGDEIHAVLSFCPHQGAEICKGTVTGTTVKETVGSFTYGFEGQVVRCPWHGWEFNITDGSGIYPGP